MTIAHRALLPLAIGTFVLLTSVRGWCDEPPGELELVVAAAADTVTSGDAFDLTVTLRNSGQDALELYHPESIHRTSRCWRLTCGVTSPDGEVVTLAPDITFANAPREKREHFRRLGPGDVVEVRVHLQADDPSATHTPSGWVGLIPITSAEFESLPEAVVKRRHGIRGEVFFITGSEVHLGIRDLLMDVFNRPGKYRLDFRYDNDCTWHWDFDAQGKATLRTVEGAWSGRLSDALVITIEE